MPDTPPAETPAPCRSSRNRSQSRSPARTPARTAVHSQGLLSPLTTPINFSPSTPRTPRSTALTPRTPQTPWTPATPLNLSPAVSQFGRSFSDDSVSHIFCFIFGPISDAYTLCFPFCANITTVLFSLQDDY